MAYAFLILAAVVVSVLMLAAVILMVIIFGHPDDKNIAWFPRIITVFGLWLAFVTLLILPYDVAATKEGGDSGVDVSTLWEIAYVTLAIMIGAIIPYAFFYYESEVDDSEPIGFCDKQWVVGLRYAGGWLIVWVIILVVSYGYANTASIPVVRVAQGVSLVYGPANFSLTPSAVVANTFTQGASTAFFANWYPCFSPLCTQTSFNWTTQISFPLYIIALVAFIGWFAFALFVGVGLFALPLDLINSFRTRPQPMSTKTYFEERQKLGERAKQLIEMGKRLQEQQDKATNGGLRARAQERSQLNGFEQNYFYLKKDYQMLYVAHKLKGGNPLVPFFELVFGILSVCISLSWFIHIAIFILPARPYSQFLNTFFIKLSIPAFPLFGVVAFAIWSFYLMWCVVKGNVALGVRFLVWKMYPMEVENTLMNAFLFNTFWILLCVFPCVQFCIDAFPVYAAYTQANVMFGSLIRYLQGFSTLYSVNFFPILILCFSALTIVVMLVFPKNRAKSVEAQLDALAKSTNTSLHDYAEP